MTHIDFVVGFLLLMTSIFFMIYFVSSSVSNNMNYVSEKELSESSKFIERYIISEPFSQNVNVIDIVLTDTKGTSHTEEISLSIEPGTEAKLYSTAWAEANASYSYTPGATEIMFTSSFEPGEKKHMRIAYVGVESDTIQYLSAENNVSFLAVSGRTISVFSADSCSGASYEYVKASMNTSYDFRLEIGNCTLGLEVPSKTDIKSVNVPLLAFGAGIINISNMRLMVW